MSVVITNQQVDSLEVQSLRRALQVAPRGRDWSDLAGVRPAAVMLLVMPAPLRVLAILRARGMRDHGGEVGFPGGKQEPADAGPRGAALREAEEELGISGQELQWLGALRAVPVVTGRYLIHPFAAWTTRDPASLRPCSEVERLIEIPLAPYLSGCQRTVVVQGSWRGEPAEMRHFQLDGCVLYGASAAILIDLLQRVACSLNSELPESTPGSELPWGGRYDQHID